MMTPTMFRRASMDRCSWMAMTFCGPPWDSGLFLGVHKKRNDNALSSLW